MISLKCTQVSSQAKKTATLADAHLGAHRKGRGGGARSATAAAATAREDAVSTRAVNIVLSTSETPPTPSATDSQHCKKKKSSEFILDFGKNQ